MEAIITCSQCGEEMPEDEGWDITTTLTPASGRGEPESHTVQMCTKCSVTYLVNSTAVMDDPESTVLTIENGEEIVLRVDNPSEEMIAAAQDWLK